LNESENKFDRIHDDNLRWALERTDRQARFEKTIIFKFCAVMFIAATLGALSTFFIGRNQLGFGIGFISIMLLGLVCIIMLIYVDLIPFMKKLYISYRKRHLSKKI